MKVLRVVAAIIFQILCASKVGYFKPVKLSFEPKSVVIGGPSRAGNPEHVHVNAIVIAKATRILEAVTELNTADCHPLSISNTTSTASAPSVGGMTGYLDGLPTAANPFHEDGFALYTYAPNPVHMDIAGVDEPKETSSSDSNFNFNFNSYPAFLQTAIWLMFATFFMFVYLRWDVAEGGRGAAVHTHPHPGVHLHLHLNFPAEGPRAAADGVTGAFYFVSVHVQQHAQAASECPRLHHVAWSMDR